MNQAKIHRLLINLEFATCKKRVAMFLQHISQLTNLPFELK